MEEWHRAGCHEFVEAIYRYLAKAVLIRDLISAKVLTLDGQGMLNDKEKIEGIAQADVFVRGTALPHACR